MTPQYVTACVQHINGVTFGGGCRPRLSSCRSSYYLFSMLQLHSFALLLAALSGGVSASVLSTSLSIVNEKIAPDGYSRL
jgi:hypothetical protein